MKKIVLSAVSCMLLLQAFAISLPQDLAFASDYLNDEQTRTVSTEIENTLNSAHTNNQNKEVLIEVEVSQQEVLYEGGGPKYSVIDKGVSKKAVQAYQTKHKYTCRGLIEQPSGVITIMRDCFYTTLERNTGSPLVYTVVDEKADFPNPSPVQINKATATVKLRDGTLIIKKDISDLVGLSKKEKGFVRWPTGAALAGTTPPKDYEDKTVSSL